jgi:hypothetical protein
MSYQQQRQHGGRLQQQQQPQPLATAVIQKPPSLKIEMGAMAQHQKQVSYGSRTGVPKTSNFYDT